MVNGVYLADVYNSDLMDNVNNSNNTSNVSYEVNAAEAKPQKRSKFIIYIAVIIVAILFIIFIARFTFKHNSLAPVSVSSIPPSNSSLNSILSTSTSASTSIYITIPNSSLTNVLNSTMLTENEALQMLKIPSNLAVRLYGPITEDYKKVSNCTGLTYKYVSIFYNKNANFTLSNWPTLLNKSNLLYAYSTYSIYNYSSFDLINKLFTCYAEANDMSKLMSDNYTKIHYITNLSSEFGVPAYGITLSEYTPEGLNYTYTPYIGTPPNLTSYVIIFKYKNITVSAGGWGFTGYINLTEINSYAKALFNKIQAALSGS